MSRCEPIYRGTVEYFANNAGPHLSDIGVCAAEIVSSRDEGDGAVFITRRFYCDHLGWENLQEEWGYKVTLDPPPKIELPPKHSGAWDTVDKLNKHLVRRRAADNVTALLVCLSEQAKQLGATATSLVEAVGAHFQELVGGQQ